MTRREEQLEQEHCRRKNEDAVERMDYEGGNQGNDHTESEQGLNNREQASYDSGRLQPERGAPDNNSRQEP